MKVQQEQLPFRPVTIKLERKYEAEALFDLIDKIESFRCNANHGITPDSFTSCEVELIRKLSDARTNQEIII